MPEPKITAVKPREIIEISPNLSVVIEDVANKQRVVSDNTTIAMFLRPNFCFLSYTISGIAEMSLGCMMAMMSSQERTVHSRQKGKATAIQRPNETGMPA